MKILDGLDNIYDHIEDISSGKFYGMTIGIVVDTNDPQQMGRIRVRCVALGDNPQDQDIEKIPLAQYVTPFGGTINNELATQGPNEEGNTYGHVSYGMWGIPKIGATVVVFCIDGDPKQRAWFGCLHGQQLNNTMPHGRYFEGDSSPDLEGNGPLSSVEEAIQPLYDNQVEAFVDVGPDAKYNYEWRTRAADFNVGTLTETEVLTENEELGFELDELNSIVKDSTGQNMYNNAPDKIHKQGYTETQTEPNRPDSELSHNGKNLDSQTYSWVTPGFHAISMDDRPENCRMRLRTSAGNQIVLDDTNERIYISTAKGKSWIEMDMNGNIDIFAERRLSVHAKKDINFTTDETFRIYAKKGIHLESDDEIRMHSKKDIHIRTEKNLRTHSKEKTFIESDQDMDLYTSQNFTSFAEKTMHFKSIEDMISTGGNIHLNGPEARKASKAVEQLAYWTNRVPDHEPWPRVIMKKHEVNLNHEAEYEYDDPNVGKREGGDDFARGKYWRR